MFRQDLGLAQIGVLQLTIKSVHDILGRGRFQGGRIEYRAGRARYAQSPWRGLIKELIVAMQSRSSF